MKKKELAQKNAILENELYLVHQELEEYKEALKAQIAVNEQILKGTFSPAQEHIDYLESSINVVLGEKRKLQQKLDKIKDLC